MAGRGRLAHQLALGASYSPSGMVLPSSGMSGVWLARAPTTENAPPGRRGASGVTTGRRDMYLYICGSVGGRRARFVSSASLWEAARRYIDAGFNQKVLWFSLTGFLLRILEQRTNVCAVCV